MAAAPFVATARSPRSDEQPVKAFWPIDVTESGRNGVTVSSAVQPLNADEPIAVKVPERRTRTSEVQPTNVLPSIFATPSPIVTDAMARSLPMKSEL